MPFGAHETMEVHEILSEKVNMISHFNFYAAQTQNPQLRDMIIRHQQEELRSYDAIVAYTHDYQSFSPLPANTNMSGVTPDQIQYGLNNPTMVTPETNAVFNDFEVANALLQAHKNAAANGVRATMEIADPNLRHMLLNGAVNCVNQAYEVFLFMNQQGLYQVPQIKDHTAKTFLHSFQPAGEALKAQYTSQAGQPQGFDQPMMGNLMDVTSGTMATQNMAIHGAIGQSGQSQSIPAVGLGKQTNRGSVGQPSPVFGQMGMGNVSAGSQTNMHQYPINQQH